MTDSAMLDQAEYKLLEESESWLAARLLANRYFKGPDVKFVTSFKKNGRWTAVQWVTTSSEPFSTEVLVYPGRVGIARRRQTAFRNMAHSAWKALVLEPSGPTLSIQIYARLGN